jgi:hypothetical protein
MYSAIVAPEGLLLLVFVVGDEGSFILNSLRHFQVLDRASQHSL